MFYHAFDGYMKHAFPRDELKPLSCGGEDTIGGYALTLVKSTTLYLLNIYGIVSLVNFNQRFRYVAFSTQIDSLDTLALLGDREGFATSVEWIGKNLRFDIVSIDFVFVLRENELINNFFFPPCSVRTSIHTCNCNQFYYAKSCS